MADEGPGEIHHLIERLTEDHVKLFDLILQGEQALNRGHDDDAREALRQIEAILTEHVPLEENRLFPQLTEIGSFQVPVELLEAEHTLAHPPLEDGVTFDARARRYLIDLRRHVEREEYDLFPAAIQLLSSEAWDRVDDPALRNS